MNNNSIWENQKYPTTFPTIKNDVQTDFLIIGAGITGLSVAYELLSCYSNITIVDTNEIFQGTTSSTTAKVTFQHGFIYHDLITKHDVLKAKQYYLFNRRGLNRISEIVERENIQCDYQKVNGYLYCLSENEQKKLDLEFEAYHKIGITATQEKINPKISSYPALKVTNQANFNIASYLKAITNILIKNNVQIYEHTRIVDVNHRKHPYALTSDHHYIQAKNIIICSHYPVYRSFNFFFTKLIPQISYSVLANQATDIENANYINVENETIALRFIQEDGNWYLNISGSTHDANQFTHAFDEINKLKAFGEKHFGIKEYRYTWCAQDYCSTDYFPYVGRIKDNIYLATGYNEWGMAAASAASLLIKDLIKKNNSDFRELCNPLRIKVNQKLITYNSKMLVTFFKTRILIKKKIRKIAPNTGLVIKKDRKRLGIYMNENYQITIVNATCPHLHCGLHFNPIEKTYDCRCHGSRFLYNGKLIDGPSHHDLKTLDFSELDDFHL